MTRSGGTTLGRYRTLQRLGGGGMADVFLAETVGPGGVTRRVVLKRIKREMADHPQFQRAFLGEARVAMRLSHGNIAQVFDFGHDAGEYFLAMELIDGVSLDGLRKALRDLGVRFPPVIAAWILHQVATGLHHAHELRDESGEPLGVVHRDVSPQNVMLSWDGQVKLVDFGIARARDLASHTRPGAIKGKVPYMSPEQARTGAVDRRTDVFAAGATLYHLLSGRLPVGDDPTQWLGRLLKGDWPDIAVAAPEVEEALASVIRRAMDFDPDSRFQTAGELGDALAGHARSAAPTLGARDVARLLRDVFGQRDWEDATDRSDARPPAAASPSRVRWAAAAVAAVVLVAVGGVFVPRVRRALHPDRPAPIAARPLPRPPTAAETAADLQPAPRPEAEPGRPRFDGKTISADTPRQFLVSHDDLAVDVDHLLQGPEADEAFVESRQRGSTSAFVSQPALHLRGEWEAQRGHRLNVPLFIDSGARRPRVWVPEMQEAEEVSSVSSLPSPLNATMSTGRLDSMGCRRATSTGYAPSPPPRHGAPSGPETGGVVRRVATIPFVGGDEGQARFQVCEPREHRGRPLAVTRLDLSAEDVFRLPEHTTAYRLSVSAKTASTQVVVLAPPRARAEDERSGRYGILRVLEGIDSVVIPEEVEPPALFTLRGSVPIGSELLVLADPVAEPEGYFGMPFEIIDGDALDAEAARMRPTPERPQRYWFSLAGLATRVDETAAAGPFIAGAGGEWVDARFRTECLDEAEVAAWIWTDDAGRRGWSFSATRAGRMPWARGTECFGARVPGGARIIAVPVDPTLALLRQNRSRGFLESTCSAEIYFQAGDQYHREIYPRGSKKASRKTIAAGYDEVKWIRLNELFATEVRAHFRQATARGPLLLILERTPNGGSSISYAQVFDGQTVRIPEETLRVRIVMPVLRDWTIEGVAEIEVRPVQPSPRPAAAP